MSGLGRIFRKQWKTIYIDLCGYLSCYVTSLDVNPSYVVKYAGMIEGQTSNVLRFMLMDIREIQISLTQIYHIVYNIII